GTRCNRSQKIARGIRRLCHRNPETLGARPRESQGGRVGRAAAKPDKIHRIERCHHRVRADSLAARIERLAKSGIPEILDPVDLDQMTKRGGWPSLSGL